MSQVQLFLIILAVVVIGLAVAVGIGMFNDHSVSSNRDAVAHDLINFSVRAHEYYRRPAQHNGGGGSFVGLTADAEGLAKITNLPGGNNYNGVYRILSAGTANQLVLEGVGTEALPGGTHVTMRILVREGDLTDSLYQVN